jgi:hypothetical protein
MIRGDHCKKPSSIASRTALITWPEYKPIRERSSSSGTETCIDSIKPARPCVGSLHRGPSRVLS